jgi:hypothetical protein
MSRLLIMRLIVLQEQVWYAHSDLGLDAPVRFEAELPIAEAEVL